MDATVRFYHGVLGARLVATIGTPDFRHYFFEIGDKPTRSRSSSTPNVRSRRSPSRPAFPTRRAVQFDHVSFNVADEHALESLRKRLDGFGCEATTIVDHGFIRSVYFTDPNGIALEASCWVEDATSRDADPRDRDAVRRPRPGTRSA